MQLNPYLMFDGQCEAAFKFYEQCFGGKLEAMLRYGEAPDCGDIPAECSDRIMHACLVIDGQKLMASDTTPQYPHEGIKGCSVTLNVDSLAEAERLFKALSEKFQLRFFRTSGAGGRSEVLGDAPINGSRIHLAT